MPRKSLPKKTKKPTTKPKRGKKENVKDSTIPETQYIDLYERDVEVDKKVRLLWLITIPITIVLVIFWFWLLKQSIPKTDQTGSIKDLRDEISRTMGEIKSSIERNQAPVTSTVTSTTDINDIKDKIVEQLQKNLDPSTWPNHDSEILGISVKYPPEWSQNEQKESITISAPSLNISSSTISTDVTYSRILINRKNVSASTKLSDWIKKNKPAIEEYELNSTTDILLIDGQKVIVYQAIDSTTNDIDQIIYVQKGKSIFEIKINVLGRKMTDEQYIKGIISNIKFL